MEPDFRNIRIVLVEPQGAFNIGSVARVMKNMGLKELALVSPADFHNDDAYKGSVGAKDILHGALVFKNIKDAVKDTSIVVGTTRRAGKSRRIFCSVEELPERIFPVLSGGKAALLFGREDKGLLKEETDLCNILVNIPADMGFPSLNLSHAVAVVAYTLFRHAGVVRAPGMLNPATNSEIERFLGYVESIFTEIGFFSKGTSGYVIPLFRRIFGRALLDGEEIKNLTHIFHRLHGLYKKGDRNPPPAGSL
jgi:tRNA/rRNA methyltransferase